MNGIQEFNIINKHRLIKIIIKYIKVYYYLLIRFIGVRLSWSSGECDGYLGEFVFSYIFVFGHSLKII